MMMHSPNRLRWGVLGTGHIVQKMGPAIQRSGNGDWLGVAGRKPENGASAADRFGVPRAYRGYEELLQDPEIDAVYIALLNHLHAEWAVKAMQAGKHVLLEKPFTLSADEARAIHQTAKITGKQVMEAFAWRFHPGHLAVREWIRAGRIGDITLFSGHFSYIIGSDSTKLVKDWGGGSIFELGCYPISWSRFFMNEEPIEADGCLVIDPSAKVDMRFTGCLYFPGGRTAGVSSAFDMPIGSYYTILGTRGRIDVTFRVSEDRITLHATCNEETAQWSSDRIAPYVPQVREFANCVLEDRSLPYGSEDAVKQMRVMDALIASHHARRRVRIKQEGGV